MKNLINPEFLMGFLNGFEKGMYTVSPFLFIAALTAGQYRLAALFAFIFIWLGMDELIKK